MTNNIILLGFMGVGKSTIGKQLADVLEMDFKDLDDLIEKEEGQTVEGIFELKGETYFRSLEKSLINSLEINNTVLSVGGGTPCFNDNMHWLNGLGTTYYLKISPDKLAERLWVKRKKRPLLKDVKSIPELEQFIDDRLRDREKYYMMAENILDVNGKASCEILEDILKFVKKLK